MNIKLKIINGNISRYGMWFRLFNGFGFSITNTPLTFSERYGYRKYYSLLFGYRLSFLK